MTIIASVKTHTIPYGTCEINEKGEFVLMNEKPQIDFLVNTGLYILKSDVLPLIPHDSFYHMTDLISDAKNNNKKIGVFPIDSEDWFDIGQWSEYKKFTEDII